MKAEVFLTSVCRLKESKLNTILLTFDDGPDPVGTSQILDILREHHVKAIFFCIGSKIQLFPELTRKIAEEGHIVANHTFSHSNFTGFYSVEKIKEELANTENLILEHAKRSFKLFRPPFGVTNPNIAKAVKELGYTVIGWNVRSFDTVSKNKENILNRISRQLKAGDIILLHDTISITPSVLKEFILLARNKGFTFDIQIESLFTNTTK